MPCLNDLLAKILEYNVSIMKGLYNEIKPFDVQITLSGTTSAQWEIWLLINRHKPFAMTQMLNLN